ncbi:GDYXXLXY domain-containing protein [Gephyromycinifex aptenodytis]|uniref:GDYXXLXY domain-containing protein n=1 Tax=Gephyromycinifex aptenodytis TaxID=2716227 RepID=UPI0014453CA5|nr:GDYXXLXY domain-containing protein [Gephyromycinifex aptenodytis]
MSTTAPTLNPSSAPARARSGTRRWLSVLGVILVQALLVGTAVAPQVSARLLGDEYRMRVQPLDPIDPFRGAYVSLDYPDVPRMNPAEIQRPSTPGPAYVPLRAKGEVWRGDTPQPTRPAAGPYLTCKDDGWRLNCGIESWFVPQAQATRIEKGLVSGTMIAVVRIDQRGNAAIVDLREN